MKLTDRKRRQKLGITALLLAQHMSRFRASSLKYNPATVTILPIVISQRHQGMKRLMLASTEWRFPQSLDLLLQHRAKAKMTKESFGSRGELAISKHISTVLQNKGM